eukprot:gene10054-11896_t
MRTSTRNIRTNTFPPSWSPSLTANVRIEEECIDHLIAEAQAGERELLRLLRIGGPAAGSAPVRWGDVTRRLSDTEWNSLISGGQGTAAPGLSVMKLNFLRFFPREIQECFRELIDTMLALRLIPFILKRVRIVCIPKTPKPGHRPLSMVEELFKVVEGTLFARLEDWFDKLPRKTAIASMVAKGFPPEAVELTAKCYSGMCTCISTQWGDTDFFKRDGSNGLMQGGVGSPNVSKHAQDPAMRALGNRAHAYVTATAYGTKVALVAFNDDVSNYDDGTPAATAELESITGLVLPMMCIGVAWTKAIAYIINGGADPAPLHLWHYDAGSGCGERVSVPVSSANETREFLGTKTLPNRERSVQAPRSLDNPGKPTVARFVVTTLAGYGFMVRDNRERFLSRVLDIIQVSNGHRGACASSALCKRAFDTAARYSVLGEDAANVREGLSRIVPSEWHLPSKWKPFLPHTKGTFSPAAVAKATTEARRQATLDWEVEGRAMGLSVGAPVGPSLPDWSPLMENRKDGDAGNPLLDELDCKAHSLRRDAVAAALHHRCGTLGEICAMGDGSYVAERHLAGAGVVFAAPKVLEENRSGRAGAVLSRPGSAILELKCAQPSFYGTAKVTNHQAEAWA